MTRGSLLLGYSLMLSLQSQACCPIPFPEAGAGHSAQRVLQSSGSVGKAGAASFIPGSGAVWLEKAIPDWAPSMPPCQAATLCP